jgi:tetratricopeptide (TPR) repeat protein
MYLLGHAEFGQAHYAEAAAALERAIEINPEGEYLFLLQAAAYGHLGRDQDAAAALAQYNKIRIAWGDAPATIASTPPYDYSRLADRERFYKGLELAGMPESPSDAVEEKNKLTGNAVRELFLGRRLQGRTYETGEQHAASITVEGMATLSGDWGNAADAKVEFSDEQICYVRPGGVRFCGVVTRNEGGTMAMANEYLWIDGRGAFTFSPVE